MKGITRICLGVGVLVASTVASPAFAESPSLDSALLEAAKRTYESEPQNASASVAPRSEITADLVRDVVPYHRLARPSFSQLQAHCERLLNAFATQYPVDMFPRTELLERFARFNQRYSDKLKMEFPEVFKLPFVPITLLGLDEDELRFFRTQTTYADKTIYGLEFHTQFRKVIGRIPSNDFMVPYAPTVNARVLGFSRAQLIPELSVGVEAAGQFEYNGMRPWSEHSRNSQFDQVRKPVELTNFAHSSGSIFTISALPDFSLDLVGVRSRKIIGTFFLWRSDQPRSGAPDLPDFIYRIVISPAPKR